MVIQTYSQDVLKGFFFFKPSITNQKLDVQHKHIIWYTCERLLGFMLSEKGLLVAHILYTAKLNILLEFVRFTIVHMVLYKVTRSLI